MDCLDNFSNTNPTMVRPTATDHMIWLGDFNRHHPMWEEDDNSHLFEPENYISPFLDLSYENDMLLAGILTYQTRFWPIRPPTWGDPAIPRV